MQNVAIIGTTGSIGKAFLEYYVSDNTTDKVYSISRSKNNVEDKKIVNLDLNLTNKNDYANLSSFIPKNSLDKVIIASGILHDDDLQPEKTISSFKKADGLVVGSALCKGISESLKKRQNPVIKLNKMVKKLKSRIT